MKQCLRTRGTNDAQIISNNVSGMANTICRLTSQVEIEK